MRLQSQVQRLATSFALLLVSLLLVAPVVAQAPAGDRWEYLFLVIPDGSDEYEEIFFVSFSADTEEEAEIQDAYKSIIYRDGFSLYERLFAWFTVLGLWGWEATSIEIPFVPLAQSVIVFKRPA